WSSLIPDNYSSKLGANGFLVASLRSGVRPLGFIYADMGHQTAAITPDQQLGYTQFIAQARLALQTCR
ncbi:hypothetical protein ACFL2V_21265, partial [Pseudomonadota bacterium]